MVDGLRFTFPKDWKVGKYDDWSFYRNQFAKMRDGIKSLDLLAVDPAKMAWLIEAKDYRAHARTKPSDLGGEVAQKVFDTLAAMLPAKNNAIDATERDLALAVTNCSQLRVVLHLEQPAKHSKLYPRAIDPAHVQLKLRRLLKPVDAHPKVVDKNNLGGFGWEVE